MLNDNLSSVLRIF